MTESRSFLSPHLALTLLFVLASSLVNGQKLSEQARISVITCGPGQQQLYSAFGHSAFRVRDPVQGIDLAYNYGVFDFDQPNFYLNFARGNNNYMLAVHGFEDFVYPYMYYDRYVHEQILDLSPAQVQQVFDFLQWNAQPDNRTYRYDYFYDNCATKIRDVLIHVLGDSLYFDGGYITTDYSIRDLTDLYLVHQPWGDLGIDICLGLPMDKRATPMEYMFLPDYIESGMDNGVVVDTAGSHPLVRQKVILYEQAKPPVDSFRITDPFPVFSLLLGVTLVFSYYDWKKRRPSIWFDRIVFGVAGWIGVLLVLLWFATDHKAAASNYNLIWALPSHALVTLLPSGAMTKRKYYWGIVMLVAVVLLLLWPWIPQGLNVSLVPVVALLAVRSGLRFSLP